MSRPGIIVSVNKKAENLIKSGHPWVYAEEVESIDSTYENGQLVDVVNSKGSWLGTGFVNDNSKILVRLISRNTNDKFDEAFWKRRLEYAINYRKTVMGTDFPCSRLIFGEADQFPGLTVDLFEDIIVTEVLSLGIENIKFMLYRLIVEILKENYGINVRAIYERNESEIRLKEGMDKYKGFVEMEGLSNNLDGHILIKENGISYDVDYINGQKTGFFLDQKYNRKAVAKLAKGKHALDCFTHTGAFALNMANGGAEHVTAVDISADAIAQAKKNIYLNEFNDKIDVLQADVFDFLTNLSLRKQKPFDLIVLDPPAFTKSNVTVKNAYRGYKEINMKAMKILPRGGYLATCSCSHFMKAEMFREMLREAAKDASVSLRLIEERKQSPDHPILWGVPETEYLKFFIFQVV